MNGIAIARAQSNPNRERDGVGSGIHESAGVEYSRCDAAGELVLHGNAAGKESGVEVGAVEDGWPEW